ncbi:MAG: anti-sigma factor family protein, partial [Planctomycetaceae bacterium]
MNVKLPDDWVSAYYDGELSPAEREEADRRLQTSAEARTELEELGRLSQALRSLPAAVAPAELRHAVLQQAERSMLISSPAADELSPHRVVQKPRRTASRRWQSVSVAIAAGVIVTTSLVLWNGIPRQNSEGLTIVRNEADTTVDGTRVAMKHTEPATDTSSMASISNFANAVPGTLTGVPLEGMSLSGDASLTQALEDHMLQNTELLGTIFKYFPSDEEQVAVVEMTVIDVRKSAGMLQVLLSQHEVMAQET